MLRHNKNSHSFLPRKTHSFIFTGTIKTISLIFTLKPGSFILTDTMTTSFVHPHMYNKNMFVLNIHYENHNHSSLTHLQITFILYRDNAYHVHSSFLPQRKPCSLIWIRTDTTKGTFIHVYRYNENHHWPCVHLSLPSVILNTFLSMTW